MVESFADYLAAAQPNQPEDFPLTEALNEAMDEDDSDDNENAMVIDDSAINSDVDEDEKVEAEAGPNATNPDAGEDEQVDASGRTE